MSPLFRAEYMKFIDLAFFEVSCLLVYKFAHKKDLLLVLSAWDSLSIKANNYSKF
jgi:hypothetical protein